MDPWYFATCLTILAQFPGYAAAVDFSSVSGDDFVSTLSAVHFGNKAGNKERPKLRIGAALTLSSGSKYTRLSTALKNGYELYFKWVNEERGGVMIDEVAHDVELSLADDRGDTLRVAKIARHFIDGQMIRLLLGPYSSTLTEYAAQQAQGGGAVLVAPGSSVTSVFEGRSRVFGTLTPASQFLNSSFTTLKGKVKTVSYISENATFTKGVCSRVSNFSAANDMQLKTGITLPTEANVKDVVAAVEELAKDPPDMLVGCVYYDICRMVLEASEAIDFRPKAMLFTICVTTPGFLEELGTRGQYIMGLTPWMADLPITGTGKSWSANWTAKTFSEAYRIRYGAEPPYQATSAWAGAQALVLAVEAANSIDPEKVAAALRDLEIPTVFGNVKFDINGQSMNSLKLVQYTGGSKEGSPAPLVAPASAATNAMVFPIPGWTDGPCLAVYRKDWTVNFGFDKETGKCQKCPVNWYSTLDGALASMLVSQDGSSENSQLLRQVGAYDPTLRRSCNACPDNHLLTESGCVECGFGQVIDPTGAFCNPCPTGTYRNPDGINPETGFPYKMGDRCTACDAGYYQDQIAQQHCNVCWPGTYTQQPGRSACNRCAPLVRHPYIDPAVMKGRNFQYFCRRDDKSALMSSFCDGTCKKGRAGKYKELTVLCCDYDTADVDIVLSDQVGFEVRYCSAGDNSVAPDNFCQHLDVPPGCEAPAKIEPDFNTFFQPYSGQTGCRACPEGLICEAACPRNTTNCSATEVVRYAYIAGPDYWVMNQPAALKLNPLGLGPLKCPAEGVCLGKNKCIWTDEVRHEGLLCSKCAAGYTRKKISEACTPCPSQMENYLWTVLGMFLLASWMALQIAATLRGAHDPKAVESIILKLFVNYCQMTAVSFTISHIGIWSFFGYFVDICDFLSQDPLRVMMKVDCLLDLRGGDKVLEYSYILIAMVIIPVTIVAAVILYTLIRLILMARNKAIKKKVERLRPSEYGPVVIVTLCFSHPIVTKYFLLLFDCSQANPYTREPYDVERLQTNLDVECNSSEHLAQQMTAVAGLVIWSLGIPCVLGYVLWKFQNKLQLKRYKTAFGFLYNGFETEVYYFESVIMIRKVLFSFCVVIPGLNDDGRVNLLLSCAVVFMAINKSFEPWDDRAYNILDRIEAASLKAVIALCLARLLQAVTDKNYRFDDQVIRDRRDLVLHVLILLQHVHVMYLMWQGLLRERARQRLLRMDNLSEAVKEKLKGKPVDMDRTGVISADKVTEGQRDFLVTVFKDAVDALLDRVAVVSMVDLSALLCCAFSIANLEKMENAAAEGHLHKLYNSSREASEEECEWMSKRNLETDLPKKILLGPVLVEELYMGFKHLLEQLTFLELTVLDTFRLNPKLEEPLRVSEEFWEKQEEEVPIEYSPVKAIPATLAAAAIPEASPAQPEVQVLPEPEVEEDLVLEEFQAVDPPKEEESRTCSKETQEEEQQIKEPKAEFPIGEPKKKRKRNFSLKDDMVIKTNQDKLLGGFAFPQMPEAARGVLDKAGGVLGSAAGGIAQGVSKVGEVSTTIIPGSVQQGVSKVGGGLQSAGGMLSSATKSVGNAAGGALGKIAGTAGGLLRPTTPTTNVVKVAPATSSGKESAF